LGFVDLVTFFKLAGHDHVSEHVGNLNVVCHPFKLHIFVRESTEAEVILGDGLRDLAVRPWLDEGLAEVLAWRSVGARPPFVRNRRDGAEALPVAEAFNSHPYQISK
jgi:hypothetical protein